MAQQSSNGNRPKLSEKGLLTPDNCVVALIDHQGQMLFGTSNFDRQGRFVASLIAPKRPARETPFSVMRSGSSAVMPRSLSQVRKRYRTGRGLIFQSSRHQLEPSIPTASHWNSTD